MPGILRMNTITIPSRNIKRRIAWKCFAVTASLFIAGVILDYYTCLLAGAMTGAGHGIFIPVLVLCGPASLFLFLWPFLIAGANSFRPSIRTAAKTITCIYYLWLLFHFRDLSNLTFEYQRTEQAESRAVFWVWAALVVVTHGLIWLPAPLVKCYRRINEVPFGS